MIGLEELENMIEDMEEGWPTLDQLDLARNSLKYLQGYAMGLEARLTSLVMKYDGITASDSK